MKFNKWTLGLAAIGAVSLTSVAQAEEKLMLGSQAQLTSTTISGYVSASAAWDFGANSDRLNTRGYAYSVGKGDGFNLDVVDINIEKPLDESEWAAGYRAEFWFGPDANFLGTPSTGPFPGGFGPDLAIKQAYVALRTPIGNGIDWKIGVFDTIIGYEASNAGDNPNYTRSWGYSIEPTQHTGILGTYRFSETIAASFGIANTYDATINARHSNDSTKAYLASVALTAPESFGFLQGGSLYLGLVSGKLSAAAGGGSTRNHYYVGVTVPTPVEGLKAGLAFDYLDIDNRPTTSDGNTSALATYLSFAATEKLTLHTRLDYIRVGGDGQNPGGPILTGFDPAVTGFTPTDEILSTTITADYQLWQNVISRVEFRWDHDLGQNGGEAFRGGGATGRDDEFSLLANVIYKF